MLIISTSAEQTSIQAVSPLLTIVAICSTVGPLIGPAASTTGAAAAAVSAATSATASAVSCAQAAVAANIEAPRAPAPQSNLRIIVIPLMSKVLLTARCRRKVEHEDLPVADAVRAGGLLDGLDHLRRECVAGGYLQFHLGEHVGRI